MLFLRYSRDWKYNFSAAVKEVCGASLHARGRTILIVPEPSSYEAEVALCREGGDAISRRAEVLSFTRLASRVFSVEGGAAVPTLDQSGRLIAMAGALELLRPKLKLYGGSITKPEFLRQLLRVVDEFHSYGLNYKSAREAMEELSGPLAEKLSELLLICELYDAVCADARQDPSTRLTRLRDALCDGSFADHAYVVVEGFSDFTEQELEVLAALTERAEQVTVYLTLDSPDGGQTVFATPRTTASRLRRLAKSRNVPSTAYRVVPPVSDSPLDRVAEQLFAPKLNVWEEKTDRVVLRRCRSTAEECAAAVRYIQDLVRGGARYRDIAVAYTDPGVYGPALETLLDRCGIPSYCAGSKEILRHSVIRGVLYALEAAACGMEADCVSEYLKSGYAPVSIDQADRLENYGFVWNLRGSRWSRPFVGDPAGPSVDREKADSAEALEELNRARVLAIEPLCELKEGLSGAKNTAAQVEALEAFLRKIRLEEKLAAGAEELEEKGELQASQELRQLYEILLSTMEQIYGVLGDTVRSPEDFCRFFRAAVTENTVGSIPAAADCVHVGEISAMRHTGTDHILILGANDCAFPSFERSTGLLSDSERRKMKAAGLQVAPDDAERMDRTLLTDYDVLTAPAKSLFVSCDREAPSYLFLRLEHMFPHHAEAGTEPLPAGPMQMAAALAGWQEAEVGPALKDRPALADAAKSLRNRAAYNPGSLDRETVRLVYGRELSLSSSKIDRLAACKFGYFLQFGLGLQERKRAELDPSVYGILVHYILEHTVRRVEEEGGFRTVSLERTLDLCREYYDRFIEEKLNDLESYSERGAYLLRRNYREIEQVVRTLYRELSSSEFIPVSFEQEFKNDTAICIKGDLAVGRLRGVVDRVDLYTASDGKTYLRVVDYKTGRKDFDYTDILHGMGLQMLIYLFALTKEAERFYHKSLQPAGVLYVPARYDVQSTKGRLTPEEAEKERKKMQKRKGLLLDDGEILRAMEEGEEPVFMPYKVSKKTGARSGDLADARQMDLVRNHVSGTLKKLTDDLGSGRIAPDPYWRGEENNACRWCPYQEICHVSGGEVSLRKLKAINPERFWESLEKEEQSRGD